MYIRKSTKKYKDKTYTSYVLVESVATPRGPRQKTICTLGSLDPRPAAEWLKLAHKVEQALVGQLSFEKQDPEVAEIVEKVRARQAAQSQPEPPSAGESDADEQVVSVLVDQLSTEDLREVGPVHVGLQFYHRLGIDEILAEACGFSPRARALSKAMILNRLIHPCSEHAMSDWVRRTALGDLLGVDFGDLAEDGLYRNLDRLHPQRELIERELARRERTLFSLQDTIYLYDLTSTYFEGQCALNPLAKRGYSRDGRPDAKQVVIGLVVDREGFPKAHEVFEGNRADTTTVGEMLDVLEKRGGQGRSGLVVVDRGMASEDNLQVILEHGHDYLVASRQAEREPWLAEFEGHESWIEIEPAPSAAARQPTKGPAVRVRKLETADEALVLCVSEGRAAKERAIREQQEGRLLTDLERLEARIAAGRLKDPPKIHQRIGRLKQRYSRVARYWDIDYDAGAAKLFWTENAERKQKAVQLDGAYLLKTNRKALDAAEIWRIYSLLTRAENAFRAMKSPLAERPIFHQLQRRVETHIFLCVLAYHLLVAIEKTLRDRGIHTSWATVRETLSTHYILTVVLPTSNRHLLRIRRASSPQPEVRQLYQALQVPRQPVEPVKTWSRQPQI